MVISDFAIRRPVVTIATMLVLVAFGALALLSLQVEEFPEVQPPVVVVSIPYPGASPLSVEREVVDRVEEAIGSISGVDEISATASDGFALIVVTFVFEKNIQEATQEIRDEISSIRADLPPEIEEPVLTRVDPDDLPIVSLALTCDSRSVAELTLLADPTVRQTLRSVEGVAEVNVVGGLERELTVTLDPSALQAQKVGVSDVVQALQAQNLAAPVGRVTGPLEEQAIRLRGRLESPQEFERQVVAEREGRLIRLGDVADARDGTEEPRSLALFAGRRAVGIEVVKARGFSTTSVSDGVRERLGPLRESLPEGVRLEIVQDAGTRVAESVDDVQQALVEGAVLAVLVVYVFLNSWRSTVITGLALPISMLAAFAAVWALGFTLNVMSLLGLTLAVGLLIDDAIVVRENIVRHIQMGKDHFRASREGTDEIGLAVSATTFTIVAIFVPVAFISGLTGQWMSPFALTMASSVLVSLFVSFSLDPMLSAYWPDPQLEEGAHRPLLSRALVRFNAWFERQADRYSRAITWALDHRFLVLGAAVLSFFTALALQAFFGGAGFAPQSDRSELYVAIEAPPGSSLDYTRLKTEEALARIDRYPEVLYTYATIGSGGGGGFEGGAGGTVDEGTIYVRLLPKADRDRSQEEIGRSLRRDLSRIGGATLAVASGSFGQATKPIQIEIRGPDVDRLNEIAERIAAEVRQVPGAVDVGLSTRGEKPEIEVTLNRGLAGSLGVTAGQVAQALRPAFAGIDAGDWVDPMGETRDVEVRLDPRSRRRPNDLEKLPLVVQGAEARAVLPLGQIASIQLGRGPAQISHLEQERVIQVQANVEGRSLSEVIGAIQEQVEALSMPSGYRVSQGGEAEEQQEVFQLIFLALGMGVLLMYVILVMQFNSFLDPVSIMVSLPLSLIGVVLALLATGDTLNIMSLIGVILLAGLVTKNAILLIDFAKWKREAGEDRKQALAEAGRIRLRPILMTTFALIAGMVPVALGLGEGGDFRAPLGRAVIGGLVTSTLLTLLVIPTVYDVLDGWKEALRRRWIAERRPSELS